MIIYSWFLKLTQGSKLLSLLNLFPLLKTNFQVINYNHVMPTRYSVDISFDKTNLNKELLKVNRAFARLGTFISLIMNDLPELVLIFVRIP